MVLISKLPFLPSNHTWDEHNTYAMFQLNGKIVIAPNFVPRDFGKRDASDSIVDSLVPWYTVFNPEARALVVPGTTPYGIVQDVNNAWRSTVLDFFKDLFITGLCQFTKDGVISIILKKVDDDGHKHQGTSVKNLAEVLKVIESDEMRAEFEVDKSGVFNKLFRWFRVHGLAANQHVIEEIVASYLEEKQINDVVLAEVVVRNKSDIRKHSLIRQASSVLASLTEACKSAELKAFGCCLVQKMLVNEDNNAKITGRYDIVTIEKEYLPSARKNGDYYLVYPDDKQEGVKQQVYHIDSLLESAESTGTSLADLVALITSRHHSRKYSLLLGVVFGCVALT